MVASPVHHGLLNPDPMIHAAGPPKTFRNVQLRVIHPRVNPCPCPGRTAWAVSENYYIAHIVELGHKNV